MLEDSTSNSSQAEERIGEGYACVTEAWETWGKEWNYTVNWRMV